MHINIYIYIHMLHMKERKRRNELKILWLIRIKIQDLPTDTVAQWIEHRRDKPRTWVQILASVILFYFFRCVLSFSATQAKRWKAQFRLGFAKTQQC